MMSLEKNVSLDTVNNIPIATDTIAPTITDDNHVSVTPSSIETSLKRPLDDAIDDAKVDDTAANAEKRQKVEESTSTSNSEPIATESKTETATHTDAATVSSLEPNENTNGASSDANTQEPMIPAPKPPAEPDMDNLPEISLPAHQKKHASNTIKAIKRLKDSNPFLHPVDIVKLNIPFYYNFIKRPMDLSTIEKKINVNAYSNTDELVNDFNLMVENCCKFNGKDSAISQMARNIQASFEKHMLNMPPKELPVSAKTVDKPNASRGRKTITNDVPKIRRDSSNYDNGRPKRKIHPPKPKDMPYDIRPKKKKYQPELRFSQQILKEFMSKKYAAVAWPFLEPVDPVAMDCPNYFDIIKEPMDLSTIQNKLTNGDYETAAEFEKDVRLVFSNCFAFNPEGTAVNMMGHKLEAIFNEKWAKRPLTPSSDDEDEDEDEDGDYDEDEEFNIDINSITDPTIEFLLSNIERMTQDLKKMRQEKYEQLKKEWLKKRQQRKKKPGKKGKKSAGANGGGFDQINGLGKKSDDLMNLNNQDIQYAYDEDSFYPKHITYEMKKEISEAMQSINEKMLKNVIAIIKEGVPDLQEDDEIELEMDILDNDTLVKLYRYLVLRKKKNKRPQPIKVQIDNEEKKIELLKQKLAQFDGMNGNGASQAAESSSDDDSDDESSEEE